MNPNYYWELQRQQAARQQWPSRPDQQLQMYPALQAQQQPRQLLYYSPNTGYAAVPMDATPAPATGVGTQFIDMTPALSAAQSVILNNLSQVAPPAMGIFAIVFGAGLVLKLFRMVRK